MERLIEDERGKQRVVALISHRPLPFRITVTDGRHRSTDQNRLLWKWIGEAAVQRQDVTPQDVQAEWKLLYGVPLLCAEDEAFAAMWLMPEVKLSYQEKLQMMRYFSVTSLMTVSQLKQYLDEIYRACTEAGLELSNPEDLKWGKL